MAIPKIWLFKGAYPIVGITVLVVSSAIYKSIHTLTTNTDIMWSKDMRDNPFDSERLIKRTEECKHSVYRKFSTLGLKFV